MIETFTSIFTSIKLEAIPFLAFGSLISSLIEVFIPEKMIKRLFGSRFPGPLLGLFGGLLLPTCECGVVPMTKKLIQRGSSAGTAVAYMFSAPIINPIVIASTYIAYRGDLRMVFFRIAAALMVSMFFLLILGKSNVQEILRHVNDSPGQIDGHQHHNHSHDSTVAVSRKTVGEKFSGVLSLTGHEFLYMATPFFIGTGLASAFKTFFGMSLFNNTGGNILIVVAVMILMAILLSICSEADAFVAASLQNIPLPGQLAFIAVGPMVDIKLILQYRKVFRRRIVFYLIFIPISLVFSLSLFLYVQGVFT